MSATGNPQPALVRRDAAHGPAVSAMFDRIAPFYDRGNRLLSAGTDRRWRRRALRSLPPRGPFLDLCAGTLDFSALLLASRPGERVVAADFSPEMLAAGAAKAPGAERVLADALALPFSEGEFQAVVCGFGMRNLRDPRQGIAEVRRVLRPGGVFATLEFFRPSRPLTRLFHWIYNRRVLPWAGGLISGDGAAYAYLAASMEGFLSRAEYVAALYQAGFSQVSAEDLSFGVASLVVAS